MRTAVENRPWKQPGAATAPEAEGNCNGRRRRIRSSCPASSPTCRVKPHQGRSEGDTDE